MRIESLNGIKRFFKEAVADNDLANGLNCLVEGEHIGPCFYAKSWLQKHKINPLDNQFYLIYEGGYLYDVVLFLPLYILQNLTEEMHSEIIKKFELKLKKVKEQLKLEKINDDF